MADPLSIAAGVTGLLAFAASSLTKGFAIVRSLQGSATDVKRLLAALSGLTGILVAIEAQENKLKVSQPQRQHDRISKIIGSSVDDCQKLLKNIATTFEKLEKSRKAALAVKWVFMESEIRKLVQEVEHYRTIFELCLGVDTRKGIDQVLDLQQEISKQLQSMKSEHERERIAAKTEQLQRERQALLQWLIPAGDEHQDKASKIRVSGTGDWLLTAPEYVSWKDKKCQLLWLKGIPGSGKTILMSRAIDDIRRHKDDSGKTLATAYFFCSYAEPVFNTPTRILLSLAAQLLRHMEYPETSSAMNLFKQCDTGTVMPTMAQSLNLVADLISAFEYTYLCVDALDECTEENQSDVLSALFDLRGRCDNLSFFLSSRTNQATISDFLEPFSSITVLPHFLRSDIDLYIRHRISRGPRWLKSVLPEDSIQKLSGDADGMFLWITCQMDHILRLKTASAIKRALTTLPKGLYSTFSRILSNIAHETRLLAARSLQWLAYACVPLRLEDLVEAIAVEETSTSLQSLDRLLAPELIFNICGSLIRQSARTGELSLAHQSVFEYLTTSSDSKEAVNRVPSAFYIPQKQSKMALTKTCLTFLSFQDFRNTEIQQHEGMLMMSSTWYSDLLRKPFFKYALTTWWCHLPSDEESMSQIWPQLKDFFDANVGNFGSILNVLRHLEGEYKYPIRMQPIHFCATLGLSQIFPYLLSDNMKLDTSTEDGRTALHMAIENGREDFVQLLICNGGSDLGLVTSDGRTGLQLALECGHEDIVRLLVTAGVDVDECFPTGDTPLSLAVENGWLSMAKFLLESNANPNVSLDDGRTSLHTALQAGGDESMLQLLLDSGADCLAADSHFWTPLHYASCFGQKEAALVIMNYSNMAEIFKLSIWTPLHEAIKEEHIEIARLFRQFAPQTSRSSQPDDKVHEELPDGTENSSLRYWLWERKQRERIEHGEFPNTREISRTLITKTATVSPDLGVPSPLFLASCQNYLAGVQFLLGESVTKADLFKCMTTIFPKKFTEVMFSLVSESCDGIWHFLESTHQGLDIDSSEESLHILYFQSWGTDGLVKLIEKAVNTDDNALLARLVEALKTYRQTNHLQQEIGELTPSLSKAIDYGLEGATGILLRAGACWRTLSMKQVLGLTSWAARQCDHDLLRKFLDHYDSMPGSQGSEGKYSLSGLMVLAAQHNDPKSFSLLAANGADWRSSDRFEMEQLISSSIRNRDEDMASLLLSQYAQYYRVQDTGALHTQYLRGIAEMLMVAVESSTVGVLESLIAIGTDISETTTIRLDDAKNVRNFTVLHLAVYRNSSSEMISYILSNVPRCIDRRDSLGRYPLHYAVQHNSNELIPSLLILHDADVSKRDSSGCTALHYAVASGRDDLVQILLDAGASLFATDMDRRTPLHYSVNAFAYLQTWPSPLVTTLLMDGNIAWSEDNYGFRPKEFALVNSVEENSTKLLRCVLRVDQGLARFKLPQVGETILHLAAARGALDDILRILLENGADIDARDRDGRTPVMIAGEDARQFLINQGARLRPRIVR